MNQKKIETILYSALGVALVFLIIASLNLIFGAVSWRIDMTQNKTHTLSEGSKKILASLDAPVELRFYCSKSQSQMPSQIRAFAQNVEDLLSEIKSQNSKFIQIKKFDPRPDTEAEDLARLDGVEPQPLPSGESLYLGLAVSQEPQKAAIGYFAPERESLLEYDVMRAISRVMEPTKPTIGVMTTLPVNGMQYPPQMMMQMRQRGQEPWVVISELKRDFDVQPVGLEVDKIADNIKVLLVIHPKGITEKTQFAIDQYIMRGGKLIACLDPLCLVDPGAQNQQFGMNMGSASSLPTLLKAWGISFDSTKVLADLNFMKQISGPEGQPRVEPAWLFLNPKGINRKDTLMSQFDNILLPAPGSFSGTPVAGLKMDVLLKSSKNSELVDGFMAQGAGQKIVESFKPSGMEMPLAMRLSGVFKTAFPEGVPGEPQKIDALKECKSENVVYLIGDSDFIYDNFCVQKMPFFNMVRPFNGNLNFVQSMVEQMAGNPNLIAVRSRGSTHRPFTVVEEMRAEAQQHYQSEINRFEQEVQDAQTKINEIMSKKQEGGQQFILPPEARAELLKVQAKQATASKALREVRKNLRLDEESLENWLKWLNIATVPLLVAAAGIVMAIIRKQKTVAR